MGGGGALFDADGDGDLDLYLTNGTAADRLFFNEDGRFRQVAEHNRDGYGMGVAAGDVDNDGDVDLYVTNAGPDRLLLNDGSGAFEDRTTAAGIEVDGWSTSAAFADVNADGLLDLYVARYVRENDARHCTDPAGRDDYCGPSVFAPETDVLLLNTGGGRFVDATERLGIARGIGAGLGVVAFDANDDGRCDLFVANDGDANLLWVQREDGTFADEALLRGAAYNRAGEAEAGMGVIAEDLDGDLRWDLFLTHLAEESHTLYRGEGAMFDDDSGESHVAEASLPFTGFGIVAVDEGRDGTLDLLVANGRVSGGFDAKAAGGSRFAEPNQRFVNLGGGRFRAEPWGGAHAAVSRAVVRGDVDGDGDADVVVVNLDGPAELWIRAERGEAHWLAVRARLAEERRDALGAVIRVRHAGGEAVARIDGGSGYLSAHEPVARFGLGGSTEVEAIDVRWPDGSEERFAADGVDRTVTLVRGTGNAR